MPQHKHLNESKQTAYSFKKCLSSMDMLVLEMLPAYFVTFARLIIIPVTPLTVESCELC